MIPLEDILALQPTLSNHEINLYLFSPLESLPDKKRDNFLFGAAQPDQYLGHYVLADKLMHQNQVSISIKIHLFLGFADVKVFGRFQNDIDFSSHEIRA